MGKSAPAIVFAIGLALLAAERAHAGCGCILARRPTPLVDPGQVRPELIIDNSRVALLRDGDRTVMTMSNDVRASDIKEFALIIPVPEVPTRKTVHVGDAGLFQDLEAATRTRLVEVHDPDPCSEVPKVGVPGAAIGGDAAGVAVSALRPRGADYGVTVEEHFDVGEYGIAILSAKESSGLIQWLRLFKYDVPQAAADVIDSYLKQGLFFFVARVNLAALKATAPRSVLRPLQVEFHSPRFTLPIRLGMVNADGPQELVVWALSRKGRIEPANYRLVRLPDALEIPGALSSQRFEIERDVFLHAAEQNQERVVFLEAAGPVRQMDLPGTPELPLSRFGAAWSTVDDKTGDVTTPTYVSRMRFRYDRNTFPEDLVLQETADTAPFVRTTTVRFEATRTWCDEGLAYRRTLDARRDSQAARLAELTGRPLDTLRESLGASPARAPGTRRAPSRRRRSRPRCATAVERARGVRGVCIVLGHPLCRSTPRAPGRLETQMMTRAPGLAVLMVAAAAHAEPALVLRTESVCREGPKTHIQAARAGDAVRFSIPVDTDSPCFTVTAQMESPSPDVAQVRLTPAFNGIVPGACEAACPGRLLVRGWIRGAPDVRHVVLVLPDGVRSVHREGARWRVDAATVRITSTPADAAVFRNRRMLGRTPLTLVDEPAGDLRYAVIKGELAAPVAVQLRSGGTQSVAVKLEKGADLRQLEGPVMFVTRQISVSGPGTLGKELIVAALETQSQRFETCLSRGAGSGSILFAVGVSRGGQVTAVTQVRGSLGDAGTTDCVIRKMKTLRFPRGLNGPTTIMVPLALNRRF